MIQYDPSDPVTRQNLVKNPIATRWLLFFVVFLLKRRRFDFLKIKIDLNDLVTRSKSGDPIKTQNPNLKLDQLLSEILKLCS